MLHDETGGENHDGHEHLAAADAVIFPVPVEAPSLVRHAIVGVEYLDFHDRLEPGVSEEKEVKLLLVLGDEVDTDYGILHSLLNVLSLQQELGEVGHTIPDAFLVLGDGESSLNLARSV